MRLVCLPPSCGAAQHDPVGCPIASATKSLRFHERFQEADRVLVNLLPVPGQQAGHESQKMRGQMGNLDPGKNQEAEVIGQKTKILSPGFCRPADEAVATAQVTGRRRPSQASDRPIFGKHQILEVLPDGLGVAQVVVVFNQTVEQRFLGSASNLLHP